MTDPVAVEPKPASTVVLVRDGAQGGIEVFLVQRHGGMGFMGGMHVFPGGKISPGDGGERMRARIVDHEHEHPRHCVWGSDVPADESIARAVAGVRETFEEAGVLLAEPGSLARPREPLGTLRARVLAGEAFVELLEQAGLSLALAALQPLSRWITPASERQRFDTTFYVARAPHDQRADHDRQESIAGDWFAPEQAARAARQGSIRLAPPTALTLESLSGAASVDEALALAARRAPPTVLPIMRTIGSDVVILYPGDPEHPVSTKAFDGPTRRVLRPRQGS
jgi:8-oxo-dGTP pyrophosphatase MutT (NUDIX family)